MTLSSRWMRWLTDGLTYALLLGVAGFMILPFFWMLRTSLLPADQIFGYPPVILSARASLNSYRYLIEQLGILGILRNTFVVAAGSTTLQLFLCSLCGYGFAKYRFPGREALFAFLLATLIVPFITSLVPLYVLMRNLRWLDTYWPLIVPFGANAFGVFFMRQYISTISGELLDAARIDGAGEFGIYRQIVLPIIAPGLVSIGLIFFMNAWNSFLWPLAVLQSPDKFTLPLTISSMTGPAGRTVYDVQMATSVISILPLLLIFLAFQRRFVEGITAGAIRG